MFEPLWINVDIRQMLLPYFWLMLLPILPWYWQMLLSPLRLMLLPYIIFVADVIAICIGRCYSQLCGRCYTTCYLNHLQQVCRLMLLPVADGIATAGWPYDCGRCYCLGSYFNLSSEVLHRTSSHMCGRWNLPMFLLRDGLLTLMYSASLMTLLRIWSSLPVILKLSMVTWWPVMVLWSYIAGTTFSSVLKKLTAVSESLAYLKNIISAIEKINCYNETSRMRNLHLHEIFFIHVLIEILYKCMLYFITCQPNGIISK